MIKGLCLKYNLPYVLLIIIDSRGLDKKIPD